MYNTSNIGIEEPDIKNIVYILQKNKNINRVILFGSRAKGTFNKGSDIDLALIGNKLNLNDILDISNELDELFLPYKFDLVLFERIKEKALIDHIERVGIVLFERNKFNV